MKTRSRNEGLSLISVLIAVGIFGLLAAAVSRVLTDGIRGEQKITGSADRTAIKNMLLESLSCQETFTSQNCQNAGDLIALRSRKIGTNSRTLVGAAGTRYGKWTVRAECSGRDRGIILRAARLRRSGNVNSTQDADFLPDPLTRKIHTWRDRQSLLFGDGIEMCAAGSGSRQNIEFNCSSRRSQYPVGQPSSSNTRHKCNNAEEVMTQCQAILYPTGTYVCGTNPMVGRDTDGVAYCTDHGCNAHPGQFWGVTVTCCEAFLN